MTGPAPALPPPPKNRPPPAGTTELPPCPVCLERLDEHISGVVTTVCNHVFHADCLQRWAGASCPVCRYAGGGSSSSSSAAFLGALSNLPGASAAAIAANAAAVPSSQSCCSTCSATHDLWICLICGHVSFVFVFLLPFFFPLFSFSAQIEKKTHSLSQVGCGRYRSGHAERHWRDSAHCYALELEASRRVWDYAADGERRSVFFCSLRFVSRG